MAQSAIREQELAARPVPVAERGWRNGFATLLRHELRLWWGTRRWLWQSLIWCLIVNGLLALATWAAPTQGPNPAGVASDRLGEASRALILGLGVFAPIGVLILAQGAVVGEKQSGTAAWLLSNLGYQLTGGRKANGTIACWDEGAAAGRRCTAGRV